MDKVISKNKVIITLTEIDTGNRFTFPMNPEEINTTCGTRFQSYDIMNIGEVKIPLGENLTTFSWKGKLPGKIRYPKQYSENSENKKHHPYILCFNEPIDIQSWWSTCRVEGKKLKLRVTNTPINHDVYLTDYEVKYCGGMGDYEYDISFVHAKDLKISTDESAKKAKEFKSVATSVVAGATAAAVGLIATKGNPKAISTGLVIAKTTKKASLGRPTKPKPDTYTVQSGDNLWVISEKMMGGGANWPKLYEANKDQIKNKDLIYPGQVFTIPQV